MFWTQDGIFLLQNDGFIDQKDHFRQNLTGYWPNSIKFDQSWSNLTVKFVQIRYWISKSYSMSTFLVKFQIIFTLVLSNKIYTFVTCDESVSQLLFVTTFKCHFDTLGLKQKNWTMMLYIVLFIWVNFPSFPDVVFYYTLTM